MAIQNGLQKNTIQGNVFLTIAEENQFSLTAYKIMQNDNTEMFIKCIKTRHNGIIRLVYTTEGYVSLRELAFKLDIKRLTAILLNTLKKARALSEYGFLHMDYLELVPSDIYVDEKTLDIKFIYMPVENCDVLSGRSGYLYRLKTGFLGLFQTMPGNVEQAYFTEIINRLLKDATMGSDELIAQLGNLTNDNPAPPKQRRMCLVKTSDKTCIGLSATELILGRNPPSPAGKISDLKIVGRQHCKISVIDGSYYITDLKSVNGTFLNGTRLLANNPVKLEENAQIRIANEIFVFKERR